jgi:hypothetical protein
MHRRRRIIFGFVAIVVALTMSILLLPLPVNLRQPAIGTLTLFDCRGREIVEIASSEARAQLPRKLGEMGSWLPRNRRAGRSFLRTRCHGLAGNAGAIARNSKSQHYFRGSTIRRFVKLNAGSAAVGSATAKPSSRGKSSDVG